MNFGINELVCVGVSVMALILSILVLFKANGLVSKFDRLALKMNDFKNTLSFNTSPFNASRTEVTSIQINEIERKLTELKESIAKLERVKVSDQESAEQAPTVPVEATPVADQSDLTFYAKFPDNDEGFTDKWLMQQQNGEQVYELILTPAEGRGTFYISEQADVQRYALSDINYYLPKGCTFINQPGKSSSIKTKEAGTLTRSGDVWVIEEKVKIEFV